MIKLNIYSGFLKISQGLLLLAEIQQQGPDLPSYIKQSKASRKKYVNNGFQGTVYQATKNSDLWGQKK